MSEGPWFATSDGYNGEFSIGYAKRKCIKVTGLNQDEGTWLAYVIVKALNSARMWQAKPFVIGDHVKNIMDAGYGPEAVIVALTETHAMVTNARFAGDVEDTWAVKLDYLVLVGLPAKPADDVPSPITTC